MAPDISPLLHELPGFFNESEEANAKRTISRILPVQQYSVSSSEGEETLFEGLKSLHKSGCIDFDDGETKILEMLAEQTEEKESALQLIQKYKSSLPKKLEKVVGREQDLSKICTYLSRAPGLNLFGNSGVGKTTLAEEVCQKMKGFVTLSIDLRGTGDMNSVYFEVLEAFGLARSDYSKERIYAHLQNVSTKTLLLLDNVEQFMAVENEGDQELTGEFLKFLETLIASSACKSGQFKVLLTSTIQTNNPKLRHDRFVEYELKPFKKDDSVAKDFISRRVKDEDSDQNQEEAKMNILDHCKGIIYFMREAEQLKRVQDLTSVQLLEKIAAQKEKGVPEEYACISAVFESLNDHLRQVAVKISLLQRPFSVSTAMKITEITSDYDAEFDLEVLAVQKIITAKGERKYDVHDLLREFISYLCKKDPTYQKQFNQGKKKFSEHFSDELIKLSEKLEDDFVGMFTMLESNRPNFAKTIDIIIESASFDLLFYSDDLKKAALIAMFFKYVVNNQKRKELFKSWSENSEKKGKLLISAFIKCWEALLVAEMEGTTRAFDTLKQARILLARVHSVEESIQRLFDMAQGMYLFCRGYLKCQECENLTDKSSSKTKKMAKKLLHEALGNLEDSLVIHRRVYGDHSLTAWSLDLIGNCHMLQFEPEKAEVFYQEAMDMKLMLIGSEKHDEIVHFYNQLSQVHQMMGDKIMKGPFDVKKVMGSLLPYKKRAKEQYQMAAELLKIALALQKDLGVCDTEDTATFQRNIANLYIALKNYDEALDYAKKSYKTRLDLLKEHPETVRILYLTGIIHEWRKDRKAALQSYEEAFAMEESLPYDNHSVVRKLLCGRLEVMCKKLNEKNKLKEYVPRIKVIMQIKSFQSVSQERAAQDFPAIEGGDDYPETAEEPATEEEVPGHPIQGDIPEETPFSYFQGGTQHGDLPDVPLPIDEPGTADTEPLIQEDLPDVPVPPEEPGTADTEPFIQGGLPDISLPPEEPGTADIEPFIQEDLPDVPLPPEEPGTADTEPLVQEDLPDVPLPLEEPTGTVGIEPLVQEDLPDVPLPPEEPVTTETGHYVQEYFPAVTVPPVEAGTAEIGPHVQEGLPDVLVPLEEPGTAETEHPVQEGLDIPADVLPHQHHMINPEGGTLNFPRSGICLDIPKHAVTQATTVTHQNYTLETLPVSSPAGQGEAVVSYIVGLEPSSLQLNKPIFVSVLHSGPAEGYGYETVVKAYNQESEVWEEPKVLDHRQEILSAHWRRYVGVQISQLTILAVVTRLITDRFQVTPKGCVVRSSVCHDVTVEFPEGAVDKTLEGTMKLLPVPNDIYNLFNVYACPMLSVKGFENVELLKSVSIQMPHPCPGKSSMQQLRLFRLKNNKWEEVEHPKIDVQDAYIKLQIQHFCWLSIIIPLGGATAAVTSAYMIYKYLHDTPPQDAFMAASRDIEQPPLRIKLHCLPNHKRNELDSKSLLGGSTTDKPLRLREQADLKIEGSFVVEPDTYVTFLEDFVKILTLSKKKGNTKTQEGTRLVFYKKNEGTRLCKFSIEEERLGCAPAGANGHDVNDIPNLNDEQKRWLVVGICLNKTLLPALRGFLKQEIEKHYDDLKAKHSIDKQTYKKYLKKDARNHLSYKSINKNKTKKKPRLFDYNVKSAEDLGKLYLMPYMAKFTDFDDACDMSAVLGILSSASVFSADVQKLAKKVKNDVRNLWGHCNFKEWTDAKFASCCHLMKSLVQALNLSEENEKRIIDELEKWEAKGVGTDSVAEFIEFAKVEIKRLSEELKRLEAKQKEQAEQIATALPEDLKENHEEGDEERALLHESFDESQEEDDEDEETAEANHKEEDEKLVATLQALFKDNKQRDEKIVDLGKRVAALEQNKESTDKKMEVLDKGQEVLGKKQEGYETRMEIVEQKVKDNTSSTDQEPVECFGILITKDNFQDLPEDIIGHMMIYFDDSIPGKEDGQWKPEQFLRRFPSRNNDNVPRSKCLQELLECLKANFSKAMSHMIELLSVERFKKVCLSLGKVIVTDTPLKENQDLAEKTIEIVSSHLNCDWETLAGHLNVPEEVVKTCKEDDSGDTHEVTRQMLKRWIETSDKSCTLADIFDALRLCGDKTTGEHLATYSTEYIRKIIAQRVSLHQ